MRELMKPLDLAALLQFDSSLGGPGICNINLPNGGGRYEIPDRDIFRPLQYCAAYFHRDRLDWASRDIVQMSGLHIEMLVQRIGEIRFIALGRALHNRRVRRKLGDPLWNQLQRFASIYNKAKHDVDQPKDEHLFSLQDAVHAYFIARMLAHRLFPLIRMATSLEQFAPKR